MSACPCLRPESEQDWAHARHMPKLDEDLKGIVGTKFDPIFFTYVWEFYRTNAGEEAGEHSI